MTQGNYRSVRANGVDLHVTEAGEGPLVLLLHGWPELGYSWRQQWPALAAAGYRAVAPDLRGFGRSDKPEAIEAYRMKDLLADVSGLLDAYGEEAAVIVGDDWGASIAWAAAVLLPHRCRALVGISVPYLGRPPMPPTKLFEEWFGDRWFHVLYFQEPGVAETELEVDVATSMRVIFAGTAGFDTTAEANRAKAKGDGFLTNLEVPKELPVWLSPEDFAHYVERYEASGFRHSLHRYRNMDRDWAELPELGTAMIECPALFLVGEADPGRALAPPGAMKSLVPNVEEVVVPGAGHTGFSRSSRTPSTPRSSASSASCPPERRGACERARVEGEALTAALTPGAPRPVRARCTPWRSRRADSRRCRLGDAIPLRRASGLARRSAFVGHNARFGPRGAGYKPASRADRVSLRRSGAPRAISRSSRVPKRDRP